MSSGESAAAMVGASASVSCKAARLDLPPSAFLAPSSHSLLRMSPRSSSTCRWCGSWALGQQFVKLPCTEFAPTKMLQLSRRWCTAS